MAVVYPPEGTTLQHFARIALAQETGAASQVRVITDGPGIGLDMPDHYVPAVMAQLYAEDPAPPPVPPAPDTAPVDKPGSRRVSRRTKE